MSNIKVSIVQMNIITGELLKNIKSALSLIKKATSDEPDVILLPEMWTTGYDLRNIRERHDFDTALEIVRECSIKYDVNIIAGSFPTIEDNKVYNTSCIVGRKGELIAKYRKIHLFKLMKEDVYFTSGNEICVFNLDGIKCGLIICYDLRFPELSRKLALEGIKILFVPAQWPSARIDHWKTLLIARAIENQVYVVSANRAGNTPFDIFSGKSMIINPLGEILKSGDFFEQIIYDELNLSMIDNVKSKMNVFEDRRPDIYNL